MRYYVVNSQANVPKNYVISLVKLKLNSVSLVRKLTILTERPLLVGEVSANFCG
jgi:hypothetical protein